MAEWFRHDVHCLQDDRLFALVSRYGAEGYAVFFHTVETMYANNGDPISDITMRRIAFELSMPFDKVSGIIEFASSESCGNLFESRPEGYVSDRVLREIEYQESQRMRYSNMGKASAERRLKDKSNAGSTQVERKLNAGSTHNITRQDNKYNKPVSNDTVFGEKHSSSPQQKQENTDLFGEKIEMEQENVPYKNIAEYWNKAVKGKVSQIRELTEQRKTLIKERWYEYHNEVYSMIDKVASADFFMQWKACGFDWCFKKQNFVKILEGTYDDNNQNRIPKGNNRSFRPRDITGQYDDIKSEVIEV